MYWKILNVFLVKVLIIFILLTKENLIKWIFLLICIYNRKNRLHKRFLKWSLGNFFQNCGIPFNVNSYALQQELNETIYIPGVSDPLPYSIRSPIYSSALTHRTERTRIDTETCNETCVPIQPLREWIGRPLSLSLASVSPRLSLVKICWY